MNNNYATIKNQIRRFCFEKLKNNQLPLELFEDLNQKNNSMIQNAKNPEFISAAVIYSYLRQNGLNGKGGIRVKDLAIYFDISPQSITSKVFDVDCVINRSAIFSDEPYEFIDKDRFKISEIYYNFLDSPSADNFQKSEKILLSMIKKDPYFFDPYTVLHEYYLEHRKFKKAFNLMEKGYKKAMDLILREGKFPDSLPWGFIENRHIIRILFNYAALLWANEQESDALQIFQALLKSNPMDNIGARYAIVGILEGFTSLLELEDKFNAGNGNLDWKKQEKWFQKSAIKYNNIIGWWLKLEE